MTKTTLHVSLLLFFFILISCSASKKAQDDIILFKIKKGETIDVLLESNPSTGYVWDFKEAIDTTVIKLESKDFIKKDKGDKTAVGAAGSEKWIFKAVGRGKTTIKLKYARPWEKDTASKYESFFVKVR